MCKYTHTCHFCCCKHFIYIIHHWISHHIWLYFAQNTHTHLFLVTPFFVGRKRIEHIVCQQFNDILLTFFSSSFLIGSLSCKWFTRKAPHLLSHPFDIASSFRTNIEFIWFLLVIFRWKPLPLSLFHYIDFQMDQ